MDERTRVWRENGLRFILRIPSIALESAKVITGDSESATTQSSATSISVLDHPYPEALMFYRRRVQPPIVAIITYAPLDHDFRGRSNQERVRLIHAIIDKAMPWNFEDVAFWPSIMYSPTPIAGDDVETAFVHVIAELNPKYILDFGGSINTLFMNRTHTKLPNTSDASRVKHIVLPSLDDMLPDNKPVKKAAWDILRGLTP